MRAMGRVALESEGALAVIYERGLRAAGKFYAQQFSASAVSVVAAGDWVPPAGEPEFDTERALAVAQAQREEVARAIEAEFARGIADLAISFRPEDFGLFSEDLMQGVAQHAGANFDASARDTLAQTVRESFDQGLSVVDTAKAIREKFDHVSRSTATMLARTDLIGMANGGGYMGARIVFEKQVATKIWLNAHDARVRPSHSNAGGQEVPLDAPFNVGGYDLMYPGDPQGPAQEVINCRCTFTVEERPPRPKMENPVEATQTVGGGFVAPPKGEMARTIFGDAKDTEAMLSRPGADPKFPVYIASRVETLHKPVVAELLKDARPVAKGKTPETMFLAGGSGVGKSTIRKKLPGGGPKNAAEIDPDGVKEMIPEYQRMVEDFDEYAAFGVHEESSMLAKTALREANERRMNAVVDGTGDGKPGDFLAKIREAQALGRKTEVVLVDVPVEVAVARVNDRAIKTGRHIAEGTVRDIHQKVARSFPEYRDVTDWQIWSTYNPKELAVRKRGIPEEVDDLEQVRTLLAESKGGVEKIYHAEEFQAFLDKADG